MENVTNVEVLQINTQPSQTSVRDLRTQIKDLKDELLNLDAGTEEYNDTLLKLGDAQHQLVELNEQMRQTTTDFGDRIGNTTRLLAGMSGAVSAVTGTLSLLGIEVGDDTKLMKLLVSAMSITQGLTAIDAGVKSFKALKISIQAATAAQKGFNLAAMKNPYIIAGAAILGALVAIIGALKKAQKEEQEFAKRMREDLAELTRRARELADAILFRDAEMAKYRVEVSNWTQEQIDKEKERLQLEKQATKAAYDRLAPIMKQRKAEMEAQKAWVDMIKQRGGDATVASEVLNEQIKAYNDIVKETNKYAVSLNEVNGKLQVLETTTGKVSKTKKDDATKTKDEYTEYEKLKNAIELASKMGEDEIVTLQRKIQVENWHLSALKEGTEAYDKQLQVIADLNAQYSKAQKAQQEGIIEHNKTVKDSLVELRKLQDEYQGLQLDNGLAQTEPITFGDIDEQRDAEIAKEQYKTQVHLEQLDMQHQADVEYWNARLALEQQDSQAYQDAMMQKNIMEQTYQNESLRAAQELEDKKTEIQVNAEQQRKTLTQKYVNVIGGLANELGGLFDAIADGSEDNYKLQRGLMVASAIITTLASSVAALYTVWSDSTLGLWAKIAMSVATVASVIATGFTLVNQMKSVKPSSGNASAPNVTAVQSLSAPISNVRQTQSHDEEGTIGGEQQSQRVVLVMSDLEAMNDTKVDVEQSTTF